MWEKLGFSRETELEGARVGGENETEQGEVPDPADEISGNNNGHGYTATAMNDDMENRRESVNSSIVENISICGDCGCLKAIMGASNKESSQHEQIEQTDTSDTAPITMPRKEPPMAGTMLLRVNGIFVVMIAGCQTFAGLQVRSFYTFPSNFVLLFFAWFPTDECVTKCVVRIQTLSTSSIDTIILLLNLSHENVPVKFSFSDIFI